MAPRYNILSDFGGPDGLASYAPSWVVGIVRFKNQNTFNLLTGQSVTQDVSYAMEERKPALVFRNAVNVQVTSSKDSHITNLNIVAVGDRNYLTSVMTGDWVVCNMLHSNDEAKRVAQAMAAGKPINSWQDGLKFLGRVQSVRKTVQVEPGSGNRSTFYNIQCAGFGEFDQALFYHPALQRNRKVPEAMAAFGLALEQIVKGESGTGVEGGSIDVNLVLPKLITAVFGKGAWVNDDSRDILNERASPNEAYLVPATVGAWLGIQVKTVADLMRPMLGIQHYRTSATATNSTVQSPWSLFQPDDLSLSDGVLRTNSKLVGLFLPAPPQYETTVWNLLETYRNHPINEMYVTLRADYKTGSVLPHLIVRQTPYTTNGEAVAEVLQQDADDEAYGTPAIRGSGEGQRQKIQATTPGLVLSTQRGDFTEFLELPRWVLDSRLLQSMDVGRSDATRFNYVHLTGIGRGGALDKVGSFIRAPPNSDELDIKRNGLRPYMTSLSSYWRGGDIFNGPNAWRDLMTDVVVGQHLMLSGTISTYGILPPIAVGDNLEFENVVYHIEQINHSCTIAPSGQRAWTTTLSVSHGVLIETAREAEKKRAGTYAGLNEEQDLVTYLPVTEENDDG